MERITYQRTLDVHKNGVQFTLQGVETGDNLSRVIEISLMASGDAIDFPLEKLLPVMYVRTPNATEPSIIECTIKNNVVVYEVLPIAEEGITEMQLKLIETSPEGATSVLVAPRFAVEVIKSSADDGSAEQKSSFTALENAVAKAKEVYDERFLRMELDSECIFRAYYADGTTYETDVLQKLFRNGNVLLSESWAKGGTGVRAGEDTNNSMYYSNVSKSASLEAKDIMADSKEVLEEVKLHGVYTAFSVDFETGEVEYVSPSYKFSVNLETGELDAIGQTYSFEDEVGRVVTEWLAVNGVEVSKLQDISEAHTGEIARLKETTEAHTEEINGIRPIEKGGTGANNSADAIKNLGIDSYQKPWNVDENVGNINVNPASFTTIWGKNNVGTNKWSIVAKNSGQVYLDFTASTSAPYTSYSNFYFTGNIYVYINDVLCGEPIPTPVKTTSTHRCLLDVEKNDIVSIVVIGEASQEPPTGNETLNCVINDICLKANIETPYQYIMLDSLENPTYNDVIDALLGVNE